MKIKRAKHKTMVSFTYAEWYNSGKQIPHTDEVIEGIIEYTIKETPEDKKEFFKNMGWSVNLAVNNIKGRRV